MFRVFKDELSDKKWPKIIVRSLQSVFKGWGKQHPFSLPNGGQLEVVEYYGMETFFGYYDRSPLSKDNRYMLFYASPHNTKLNPNPNKPIFLILFDLIDNQEIKNWEIHSYNWQQGSKAQWLTERSFIFNNYSEDKGYYAIIYDIDKSDEVVIEAPNYESCNNFTLSLNFCRLSRFRPDYGYRNIIQFSLDDTSDGVYKCDFATNQKQLLVSISELMKMTPVETMNNACHKVNHIMLSPNRDKFMFMHRWIYDGKKDDRLYVYNLNNKMICLVADYGMVSHCYWLNNDNIVGYMNGPGKVPGYYVINIEKNTINKLSDSIQHFGDGHPSVCDNKMVFDTYPDSNRLKHLFLFDFNTNELEEIAIVKESLGYECQCRCDCHPRFVNNDLVLFDSTHTGKRQLCFLKAFNKSKDEK